MNMPRMQQTGGVLVVCVLAVAGLAGCAAHRRRPQPPDHMGAYRRVTVLEFYYDAPHEDFGAGFEKHLADALSGYTHGVDVNTVALTEVRGSYHRPLDRGAVPLDVLTEMRRRYMADAVVVGRIDSFNPYYFDLSIGVSLKAVDTADGTVFFSSSRTWNAGDMERRGEIRRYYEHVYGSEDIKYYGPHLLSISPSFFTRYVADCIARELLATFED